MPSLSANKRPPKPVAPPSIEHHSLPCPRCDSINTKFCYFNNYNFSQPRHFCKSCRRYWTHGGALRDIPIGGASRKTAKRVRFSAGKPPIQEPINGNPLVSITYPINANGFASFITSPGPGILGLGGYGLENDGFGLGLGVWAFPEGGFMSANRGDTWQVETGGNGDCFPPFP